MVLRNNVTTEEHPDGVFHPHAHLHHIKKENIDRIIEDEIGLVFAEVLEDCGVYKLDEKGMVGIEKFVKSL